MNKRDLKSLLINVKIREVMSTSVHTVKEEDPLSKVQEIFTNHGSAYVPVVDENGKLTGLISHKYIYRTLSPRRFLGNEMEGSPEMVVDGDSYYFKDSLDKYFLKKVMKKDPLALGPEDPLWEAVTAMAQKRLGCIVVINEHKEVVGLVTEQDVVRFLADNLG